MDDELVQLFFGPRRGAVRTQIVQYQKFRVFDLLKKIVVTDPALRAKRLPQVVKEVRHEGEGHGQSERPAQPGDGYRQMRFANAGLRRFRNARGPSAFTPERSSVSTPPGAMYRAGSFPAEILQKTQPSRNGYFGSASPCSIYRRPRLRGLDARRARGFAEPRFL